MRLFSSDRIAGVMDRLGFKEGEMIEHKMISNSIERAQKKVEENNFGIRKRLLEYDDVMNKQRTVVYTKRRHALMGERIGMDIVNMIWDRVAAAVEAPDYENCKMDFLQTLAMEVPFNEEQFRNEKKEKLAEEAFNVAMEQFKRKTDRMAQVAYPVIKQVYETQGHMYENILIPITDGKRMYNISCSLKAAYDSECKEVVKAFEKSILLHVIDEAWKENLRELDELKHSVQNASYEQKDPLLIYKLESVNLFDTMVAHYVLQPELRHNMDYLAEIYLHYQTIHIEELIGPKGKGQKNMRDLSPEAIYKYACEDADVTLKLKNILEQELKTNDAEKLFYEIEMPLVPVLTYMERNGVRVDTEALKQTSEHFTARMNQIEEEVHQLAGTDFNIASPKQVGEVLFDKLRIVEKAKKTKTGQYVTSEEVLESLRGKHEIVGKILEHRGLKKLLGTYIDALPLLINKETGKIHTSFNQTVTATGRLSSSNPNLQNIPIRNEDGKEIRKAFIPDDGCEFFSADYSQIELRIMAHLSGDANMIEAFKEGDDIHAATAAKVYKISIDKVTREQRSKAKTANFGIIYGISVFGLAERMNVDRKEAKELIDGYFETYPQIKEYMDKSIDLARGQGYIETIFGRKRYLPDINSRNSVVRGYAERNAINAPIQGSAADIIKVAMVRIYQRFQSESIKSKMILQVHDELNFSVLPEEKEKVQKIVIEEMENAYRMQVPLRADCGCGSNWLEAH